MDELPDRAPFKVGFDSVGALRFTDSLVERRYQDEVLRRTLPQTGTLAIFGFIAASIFLPIDRYYVADTALQFVTLARLCLIAPATVSWVAIGYLHLLSPRAYYRWVKVAGLPIVYTFPTMILLSGTTEGALYGCIAQTQVVLFLALLLRLPLSFAIPNTLLSDAVLVAVVYRAGLNLPDFLLGVIPVIAVSLLALAVAYRIDYDSRRTFMTEELLRQATERERRSERDRLEWLEILSKYLKHEFRNALLGVTTSLDRLERVVSNEKVATYTGRARNSVELMQRLLTQTAEAASVSAALDVRNPVPINLGELMRERTEHYASAYPEQAFEFAGFDDVWIPGEREKVMQIADNLVSNAVEHSSGARPIVIEVRREADGARVSVENRGDALTADLDEMTRLFWSRKSGRTNLGLGLYVVSRLVDAHGGRLAAEALSDPTGARFSVTLPSAETQLIGEQAVRAPRNAALTERGVGEDESYGSEA